MNLLEKSTHSQRNYYKSVAMGLDLNAEEASTVIDPLRCSAIGTARQLDEFEAMKERARHHEGIRSSPTSQNPFH